MLEEDITTEAAPGSVSAELDALSCDLLASALDALAQELPFEVLLAIEYSDGTNVSQVFEDDSIEACLEGAHQYLQEQKEGSTKDKQALRYALVYQAAVADEQDNYSDALILEFGEKGAVSAYSAYCLIELSETGEILWSDPAPAGEVDLLL